MRPNTCSVHCRDGVVMSVHTAGVGVGMLYSACVRLPPGMSPINDNTQPSSNIEISTCEFGTSTQAQALHFMTADWMSETHLQQKPTLALQPILQFCRISCGRGDNKLVLQSGQPRWKGLKLHTGSGLAVWFFLVTFLRLIEMEVNVVFFFSTGGRCGVCHEYTKTSALLKP